MFTGRRMHGKPCVSVCGGTMAADALIDTGALLALVDRTDRWHRISVNAFEQLRLPLVTSEAVLTELFHLVGDSRHEMEAAWRLVRSGAIVLAAIEDSELSQIHALSGIREIHRAIRIARHHGSCGLRHVSNRRPPPVSRPSGEPAVTVRTASSPAHALSISSKVLFLVSGTQSQATAACAMDITARNPNVTALPIWWNAYGKKSTTTALAIHCVSTGMAMAVPRMLFGKI